MVNGPHNEECDGGIDLYGVGTFSLEKVDSVPRKLVDYRRKECPFFIVDFFIKEKIGKDAYQPHPDEGKKRQPKEKMFFWKPEKKPVLWVEHC